MNDRKKPATAPKKRAPAQPVPQPTYMVQNCTVTNGGPTNEHTRAAVEALAAAATANAQAIGRIADALKGENAAMEAGIRVGA